MILSEIIFIITIPTQEMVASLLQVVIQSIDQSIDQIILNKIAFRCSYKKLEEVTTFLNILYSQAQNYGTPHHF